MSLQSWIDEFITDTGDLVQDGINKWTGVKKSNLNKHDCYIFEGHVEQYSLYGRLKSFDLSECGLCDKYQDGWSCTNCPLFIVRGNVSCDFKTKREGSSPWHEGIFDHNPASMIKWLEKAKIFESEQETTTKKGK